MRVSTKHLQLLKMTLTFHCALFYVFLPEASRGKICLFFFLTRGGTCELIRTVSNTCFRATATSVTEKDWERRFRLSRQTKNSVLLTSARSSGKARENPNLYRKQILLPGGVSIVKFLTAKGP